MLCKSLQDFKVVWECFAGATGVIDGNRNISTGSKWECHGHSVIVVCVYSRHIEILRWSDHTVIWSFFNCCSQLKYQAHMLVKKKNVWWRDFKCTEGHKKLAFLSSVQTAIILSVSFTLQLATRKIGKPRDQSWCLIQDVYDINPLTIRCLFRWAFNNQIWYEIWTQASMRLKKEQTSLLLIWRMWGRTIWWSLVTVNGVCKQ